MSLNGALHIGATGLTVNQRALQVVGNNLANAATEGYARQRVTLVPGPEQQVRPGAFVGTGVRLAEISRVVDEALNDRLRSAIADQNAALKQQDILAQIESIESELTDQGLSSRLNQFFSAWAELANNPTDTGLRSLVIAEGRAVADFLNDVQTDLASLRTQVDNEIRAVVRDIDGTLERIAEINGQIAVQEAGAGGANALRDQRDQLLADLAEKLDITTIEDPAGFVNVYVNSTPVVLASDSRGLAATFESVGDAVEVKIQTKLDGNPINPDSGALGALLHSRTDDIGQAVDDVNAFAGQLIFELNKVHSSGQGEAGFTALTSADNVNDATAALNTTLAGLDFTPGNGTFDFHVTQKSTGLRTTTRIDVDLDGVGAETTLNDLAAAITASDAAIAATVTAGGKLSITSASSDFEFSFSDDSSGVLAALGLNTYFTGKDAHDIAVNAELINDPRKLATAQNHIHGDNRNAQVIAQLGDASIEALGGASLRGYWQGHVEEFAVRTAKTSERVEATTVVAEGLEAQWQGLSGVNIDEEAINLLQYQRAFQGAARFITTIDELMQTLIGLVR